MNMPTNTRFIQNGIISLLAAAAVLPAAAAPPVAKITVKQAKAAALKKIPGTVTSTKYEFEDGRWQYAVLVAGKSGGLYEVEVSSTSGKVLDSEKTSAAEEASESAADKKAAAKSKGRKN